MQDRKCQREDAVGELDTERRGSRRHRVLKSGLAAYNHHYSTLPCVMRNESGTGARLEFGEISAVPDAFTLHVGLDGYQVECERVWHEGTVHGVKFVGEKSPSRIFDAHKLSSSTSEIDANVRRAIELQGQAKGDVRPAVIEVRPRRPKSHAPVFGRRS